MKKKREKLIEFNEWACVDRYMHLSSYCEKEKRNEERRRMGNMEAKWEKEENVEAKRKLKSFRYFSE